MQELSHESIAAQLQALNGAVMALIQASPNVLAVGASLREMALRWEGMTTAQPIPDSLIEETAKQLRRFAAVADAQAS